MAELIDTLLTKLIGGSAKDGSDAGWSQKHLEQILTVAKAEL